MISISECSVYVWLFLAQAAGRHAVAQCPLLSPQHQILRLKNMRYDKAKVKPTRCLSPEFLKDVSLTRSTSHETLSWLDSVIAKLTGIDKVCMKWKLQ